MKLAPSSPQGPAKRSPSPLFHHAPVLAGAFFLWITLLCSGCKPEESTPEWTESSSSEVQQPLPQDQTTPSEPPPAPESVPTTEPTPAPVPTAEPTTDSPDESSPPEESSEAAPEPADNRLRFVSYNLKNYLTMTRYSKGERIDRFKPADEIKALVRLVVAAKPDVFGVCEIGTFDDLVHLQTQLKEAGLDLPHLEHASGADQTRHLGLLSRLPIAARNSPRELHYDLQGRDMTMSRGILDTTIQAGDQQIRFLGVHLKSKREIPEADQELMRRNEAYLLRKHLDTIFKKSPEALIVSYGDFNDTRRTTAVRSVQGAYNSPRYLEALTIKDSRGEVWTHYWDYQHVYSRFDYVLVSKAMRKLVENKESRILDAPEWTDASDHRALLTVFEW